MTTSQAASIGFFAIAFAALCGLASAQTQPATTPSTLPFTLGKDTTRLTSPLRPDGTVDYIAALNAEASKGVTKANNAAVLLVQVLGPEFIDPAVRTRVYKALDIKPDASGQVLNSGPANEAKYSQLLFKPWQAKDYPEAAAWLKDNAGALGLIIAASRLPRYYVPLVTPSEGDLLVSTVLPKMGLLRSAARALAMRANLAVAEGRVQDAWADIQAIYRLAALMEQEPTLIGRLVGIACSGLTDQTAQNLATKGTMDAKRAKAMLSGLPEATPAVIDAIDHLERFVVLDSIAFVGRHQGSTAREWRSAATRPGFSASMPSPAVIAGAFKMMNELMKTIAAERDVPAATQPGGGWAVAVAFAQTDWNAVLRRANGYFDAAVAGMAATDLSKRAECQKQLDAQLKQMMDGARHLPATDDSPQIKTQWYGDLLLGWLLFDHLMRSQTLADVAGVERHLTQVALGLAVYKAEKGSYPDRLADLSPGYLKKVPKDFFSGGKDFIYKPADGGYVLYSVGENGQDDGGKDKAQGGDDIVVRAEPKAPAK